MSTRIYLDNASTSFPKAPGVSGAMARFVDEIGINVSRGGYAEAYEAAGHVIDTRERLAALLGAPKSRNVLFTASATHSLNIALKGLLRPGDHVLASGMEHNAVMRPLHQLMQSGVRVTHIPGDIHGRITPDDARPHVTAATKALLTLHASNVNGAVMPVRALGEFAHANGLLFIVDAAQTAGVFPIDVQSMHIDALAFPGHKGLLGPQGIGGLVLSETLAARLEPLIAGGTGSLSDDLSMPPFLPDRFEAGTPNLPGIYGLNAALCHLRAQDIDARREREVALARRLHEALWQHPDIRLLGPTDWACRAPVVSIDCPGRDNAQVAYALEAERGVLTRCGLHCAPAAHRTLGTYPHGTIRFSPGHATTRAQIDQAADAVLAVLAGDAGR